MNPITTLSNSPQVETKAHTSSACSTEATELTDSFLKRSSSMESEPLSESVPKRRKIAESREVRRKKCKASAALSRKRKKEKKEQLEADNAKLKEKLMELKQQLGLTLDTKILTSEQDSPSIINISSTEQPLQLSSEEKRKIQARAYQQAIRDREKLALMKIETENANMASEIESLESIIKQQTEAVSLTNQSSRPPSASAD